MKLSSDQFQLAATDLSNHLSCEHLTQLERKVALGEIKRPSYRDPSLDVLIKRGQDHETAYVKFLTNRLQTVIDLKGQPVEASIDAMKKGIEIIVQPQLEVGMWGGYVENPEKLTT